MHSVLPFLSISIQPKENSEEKDMQVLGALSSMVGLHRTFAFTWSFINYLLQTYCVPAREARAVNTFHVMDVYNVWICIRDT